MRDSVRAARAPALNPRRLLPVNAGAEVLNALAIVCIASLGLVVYVYVGYPLVVLLLARVAPARPVRREPATPRVTFIISVFNEEAVLEAKLANALAFDYPADQLEIMVVSDCSDDRSDEIARAHADRGVRLVRQEERLGKTSALNLAVPQASGDIVVFSDANAMYEPDAVRELVANFADDTVGYVVGEARYVNTEDGAASSEASYWSYEIAIKTAESRIHSMVGGDGAIYAIRKSLYEPLLITDINDFVNPLQIIAKGYRGIYEPRAVCHEEAAGSYDREFRRKVRIVNRSFSGLMRVPQVMNPLRTGLFSPMVISHKLLRWLVPYFIATGALATGVLALAGVTWAGWLALLGVLFYLAYYVGYLAHEQLRGVPVLLVPYYFILVNVAAGIGVARSLGGSVQATWNPPRTDTGGAAVSGVALLHHGLLALGIGYAVWFLG